MINDDIYVTADTHFNHKGIIKFCARPYDNVVQMNEDIIEQWNAIVPMKADVWFLGDFGFDQRGHEDSTQALSSIFARLSGYKHLVIGNHDQSNPGVLELPWKSKCDLTTIKRNGIKPIACHYPMLTWKNARQNYIMLHGHSHGTLEQAQNGRLDVGWDVFQQPITLSYAATQAGTYLPV